MKDHYLTRAQCTCAGRIFLNVFELRLEDFTKCDDLSVLSIYDKSNNIVGEMLMTDTEIKISVHKGIYNLEASYDISKYLIMQDIEASIPALYGEWSTTINFTLKGFFDLNGEFLINSSFDSEFGLKCSCHPLINLVISDNRKIEMKFLRNGRLLSIDTLYDNQTETIDIMPWDSINGFIKHDYKKGNYDNEKHCYPYRKYSGIFDGSEPEDSEKTFRAFLKENLFTKLLSYQDFKVEREGEEGSALLYIQQGLLMKCLDADLFNRINQIRDILNQEGVSLFDSIVSVCYDSYEDREIEALIGIKRQKMIYQNGANNLTEAYFGIGKESPFLSQSQQQNLIRKHNNH